MKSRSSIQAVLLENSTDAEGNSIPLRVEINSWVALQPGKSGRHAKDAAKLGGSYKAKVVAFRMSPGMRSVSEVQVQHAYMRRQLDLDQETSARLLESATCNYLYLSDYRDWVHPQSIMGVIVVMHAEVGELTRGTRSHVELLRDSVFFYNAFYKPRHAQTTFGTLESIPLPSFDSPDWPLPDMATTESFRGKLRLDFHNSMRPTTGSKQTHLSWFMPIGVFVDLFHVSTNMHRSNQMFIFKQVDEELCASLMDKGWNEKITKVQAGDFAKTSIPLDSMKFRYHISRSTLYANFVYRRHKMLRNKTWEALDQYDPLETITLHCELDSITQSLEVGTSWSIQEIRQEIQIQFGPALDYDFDIHLYSNGVGSKINPRHERSITALNCAPPKKLQVVQR